jgi:hypothetical protein
MKTTINSALIDLKRPEGKQHADWPLVKLTGRLTRQASIISKLISLRTKRTKNRKNERLSTLIKLNIRQQQFLSEKCQQSMRDALNEATIFQGLSSQKALALVMHMHRNLTELKSIVDTQQVHSIV